MYDNSAKTNGFYKSPICSAEVNGVHIARNFLKISQEENFINCCFHLTRLELFKSVTLKKEFERKTR